MILQDHPYQVVTKLCARGRYSPGRFELMYLFCICHLHTYYAFALDDIRHKVYTYIHAAPSTYFALYRSSSTCMQYNVQQTLYSVSFNIACVAVVPEHVCTIYVVSRLLIKNAQTFG